MSLGCPDYRMFHDFDDAIQVPGFRCPRVLVEKVPALLKFVPVQRAAELDVLDGFGLLQFVLLEPSLFILVLCLVEFL